MEQSGYVTANWINTLADYHHSLGLFLSDAQNVVQNSMVANKSKENS
jgi:hypothetical protein